MSAYNLDDLRARLVASAEQVCRYLLPGGRRSGNKWICGGVDGGPGKSMDVVLDGEKAGLWNDRATDDQGDMIALWMSCRSVDFKEAVRLAADFLGMQLDRQEHRPKVLDPRNFRYDENFPDPYGDDDSMPPPPPPGRRRSAIDWQACVDELDEDRMAELAEWRGFSMPFVQWLKAEGLIGIHRGNYALPVHDKEGQVVRVHYKIGDKGWAYYPTGGDNTPLIIGDIENASYTLAFESQWDAFATLDKLEAHKVENIGRYAAIITRGATSNTDFSKYEIAHLIACPQNDPPEKAGKTTGRTPAEEWLFQIQTSRKRTTQFAVFETPKAHKDINDWVLEDDPDHFEVFTAIIEGLKAYDPLAKHRVRHDDTLGMSWAEIDALRPPYVIDGFVRRGEVLLLGAESKSRKSWLAQDAGFAVAAGIPWLATEDGEDGFETRRARVHVFDLELAPSESRYRFAKARGNRFLSQPDLAEAVTMGFSAYSFDGANVREIFDAMEKHKPTIEPGDLVIVDCLYRLQADGNEVEQLAIVLETIKRLASETQAGVILVDHFRKAGDDKARNRFAGSFIKQASASTLVAIEVMDDGTLNLNIDARTFHGLPRVWARWDQHTYSFIRIPEKEIIDAQKGRKLAEMEGWLVSLWRARPFDAVVTAAEAVEKWGISRQSSTPRLRKLMAQGWLAETILGTGKPTEWTLCESGKELLKPYIGQSSSAPSLHL